MIRLIMSYNDGNGKRRKRSYPDISPELTLEQARNFAGVFAGRGDNCFPEGLTLLEKMEKAVTTTTQIWPGPEPEEDIDGGVIPDSGPIPAPENSVDGGVIPETGPLPEPAGAIDSGEVF